MPTEKPVRSKKMKEPKEAETLDQNSPYSQRAADTEEAFVDAMDAGEFDDMLFPNGRKMPLVK